NEQGAVTLGFEVGPDNQLKNSTVLKSSGFTDLDEAAREAVAKCQFKAATQAGKPVASNLEVQYVWSLK
ncbi:MAG: energy transducer TonB, partial [Duganella sp.]